jgi:tetratricopeptide (TPR) repeat protein
MKNARIKAVFFLIATIMLSYAALTFASETQGDKYFDKKEYRKAINEYEDAVKSSGETEALLLKLAKSYDALNWYGQSVQYWEKYINKYPKGAEYDSARKKAAQARRWLAVNFYNLGENIDVVVHQLDLAIKLDPALYDAYFWLGRVCIEDGRFETAASTLQKLVAMYPDDKPAKWLLNEAQGMMKYGGKAYASYSSGYDLYKKADFADAIAKYKEAIAQNPSFADAYLWIGRILMESEKYDEAIPYWQKVIKLQPGNKRADWFLKLCRRKLQEKKKG